MAKRKMKYKCPECDYAGVKVSDHKWTTCNNCLKTLKSVRFIVKATKEHRDRHDKRVVKAKKQRKDKFLTRQSAILKNCQTVTEGEFGKRLTAANIEFIPQWTYNVEGFAGIVDFYLPEYKLVLEVDGGYHLEDDQKLKDMEKDFICRTVLHKKVLRLTNKQALSLQMGKIIDMIKTS